MASAHKIPAVTKTTVVEVEPERYVIELTADEAAAMRGILGVVNTRDSIPQFSNLAHSVYQGLSAAGVPFKVARIKEGSAATYSWLR